MSAKPIGLIITAAVALGIYLGLLYLRGERRVTLIGVHVLLGIGGLEGLVILIQGTPSGESLHAGSWGRTALALFAGSVLTGLLAPLIGKRVKRNGETMLVVHAGVGLAGFLAFLTWANAL
jgi:hypothetical protein